MAQVFLSYSRRDEETVFKIRKSLERRGIDVWIDQDDIGTGSRWDIQIEQGIQESRIILVVLSPASVESPNVGDEWSYALDKGKHIIPVMLEQCEVPMRIASLQRIEFFENFEKGMANLAAAILEDKNVARAAGKRRKPFNFEKFFSALKPVVAIAFVAAIIGGGYYGYQNYWSWVQMPEQLVGQPLDLVRHQLKEKQVSVGLVYVEHADGEAGTVLSITPASGSTTKRFSTATVRVVADKVGIPDVLKKPYQQAMADLVGKGFRLNVVREVRADVEVGSVFKMLPSASEAVEKHAVITLYVAGKGGWIFLEKGESGEIVTLDKSFNLRESPVSTKGAKKNVIGKLAKDTPVLINTAHADGWRNVRVIDPAEV
jgi:Uncharacterized protein conserved in bacteria